MGWRDPAEARSMEDLSGGSWGQERDTATTRERKKIPGFPFLPTSNFPSVPFTN